MNNELKRQVQTFDNNYDRRKAKDNLINVLLIILGLAMLGMLVFNC